MKRPRGIPGVIIVMLIAALAAGCDAKRLEETDQSFVVRVVDEQGNPVLGAKVSHYAFYDNVSNEPGWRFQHEVNSTADGLARFSEDPEVLEYRFVSAFDFARNRVAVASLDPKGPWEPAPTLVLHPACKVSAKLTSAELAARGKPLGWTNSEPFFRQKVGIGFEQEGNGHIEFLLPPGEYRLESYGRSAFQVNTEFTVKPGLAALDLGEIDLPATQLALLEGRPAPEIKDIVAWKNGPITLADCRGKWVVLDFWGWWCGPCIGSMPGLIELYDAWHERGLVVIGVHVDLPTDSASEAVDTVEKLDAKLVEARKESWNDRDIPFPVALAARRDLPHVPRVDQKAFCQASADYGVWMYPTQVLIDPQGNVVGRVRSHTAEERAKIEEQINAAR